MGLIIYSAGARLSPTLSSERNSQIISEVYVGKMEDMAIAVSLRRTEAEASEFVVRKVRSKELVIGHQERQVACQAVALHAWILCDMVSKSTASCPQANNLITLQFDASTRKSMYDSVPICPPHSDINKAEAAALRHYFEAPGELIVPEEQKNEGTVSFSMAQAAWNGAWTDRETNRTGGSEK